jgi:hypothetical protein
MPTYRLFLEEWEPDGADEFAGMFVVTPTRLADS